MVARDSPGVMKITTSAPLWLHVIPKILYHPTTAVTIFFLQHQVQWCGKTVTYLFPRATAFQVATTKLLRTGPQKSLRQKQDQILK